MLVEFWDGSSWSVVPSPNTGRLFGVSCPGETSCYAVGQSGTDTVVERWDGNTWSVVPTANTQHEFGPGLVGVSCSSPTSCYAVGYIEGLGGPSAFTESSMNGSPFSVVSERESATRVGVSCPGATVCFSVGNYLPDPSHDDTLVERLTNSGTWSIVSSPNPFRAGSSALSGVSCATATSCFAVGHYYRGRDPDDVDRTLGRQSLDHQQPDRGAHQLQLCHPFDRKRQVRLHGTARHRPALPGAPSTRGHGRTVGALSMHRARRHGVGDQVARQRQVRSRGSQLPRLAIRDTAARERARSVRSRRSRSARCPVVPASRSGPRTRSTSPPSSATRARPRVSSAPALRASDRGRSSRSRPAEVHETRWSITSRLRQTEATSSRQESAGSPS